MNWLRCKARADRWNEEKILVEHEMAWSVAYFEHWMNQWGTRATVASEEGHRAYALRSKAMWEALKDHAKAAFETALGRSL